MKNLAYIVRGKTFLKSMMPLIIFSNSAGIRPIIFCQNIRPGKQYDNIDIAYLEHILKSFENNLVKDYELHIFKKDEEIMKAMGEKNIDAIMCQDTQHHARSFCENKNIQSFSIGVFFDTLHYSNDIRLGKTKPLLPSKIYFPNRKFELEFKRISEITDGYKSASLGSPLFDHSIFIEKNKKDKNFKNSVCFLTTLQSLVPENLKIEIEDFAKFCENNHIKFIMKSKYRTPWIFKDKNLKIHEIKDEQGFPHTSLGLILNTDIHISSYSTSACESNYFGKPCVNIESVKDSKLTYAVNSIKNDYMFDDVFNSETCKTISSGLKETIFEMIDKKYEKLENIDILNNSSMRILSDIVKIL
jgi:hypothetical protein